MNNELQAYYDLFHRELFGSCLPFWEQNAPDAVNGGIYNGLDRCGKIYSTDKSVWMQGRCAWMFSQLYNKFGQKQAWLELAASCIGFLDKFCIDKSDRRMYFMVTGDGRPLRKRRYFYSEAFYILANAAYYTASKDVTALKKAREYYDFVVEMYQNPASDPYKITPKTIADTRSMITLANPMILLNVTSVMREHDPENKAKYDAVSKNLINDILTCFYKPELHILLENVAPDGSVFEDVSVGRVVNPGHSMEAAWFLLDEALYFNDPKLLTSAKNIFDDAFKSGWDEQYGGILYFKDFKGLPVEAYEHDMKLWWPHNEAIIAALKFYRATQDSRYLGIFQKVCAYAFEKFSDREYGEWFGYLRRDGIPTEPPCKGHTYKGPFHLPRMLTVCLEILPTLTGTKERN